MPNIKSAKKRVLVSAMRNEKNRAVKSGLKTKIKKFDAVLANGEDVSAAFVNAVKSVDKAAAKGAIHKNAAARKKSQLAKKLNAAQ
ncbi:MAG: 30S ribosomal protein S20 [Clostridium sp. SCN 57-10]|nr:MAG: 30S ribosomal protein S20 [Clostridium sp. SCN 57-10]